MLSQQCRFITRNGFQCKRMAESGGVVFCWQHVPLKGIDNKEKWDRRIKVAGLAASSASVIIKLVELAVNHFHELFSSGHESTDKQSEARDQILEELEIDVLPPRPRDSYQVRDPIDWITLSEILVTAKRLQNQNSDVPVDEIEKIESKFSAWFEAAAEHDRKQLLGALEDFLK